MASSQLAMSSTKDELLRHLNLPTETYTVMAKETDTVYMWLTSDKNHLKSNCKRKPPYDWSDIRESSKDDAVREIAKGGDEYTSYYWQLAVATGDCPNWIARWFLYHKFRYRDGRNRTHQKSTTDERKTHTDPKSRQHRSSTHQTSEYVSQDHYYEEESIAGASSYQYSRASSSSEYYEASPQYATSGHLPAGTTNSTGSYYDPVRDV